MLKGKTALVTGSTSGIGKAIATRLAKEGCNIVLNGFGDPGEVDALKRSLASEHGVMVGFSSADLTRIPAIENMMTYVGEEFGGADIVVNNAGMQFVSPLEDFPVDKWNLIIALNLSAAFHTTRLAIPGMKQKGWGRIINIGSAHSKVASPFKAAYVAAKHGITGLTKVTALEGATHG
ncbi:MAG: SDR family NAD(P)-dependent oxidoreductase, partial [Hyphomonas sp.]|nr:SDR family NAD(P)-dependent oxidoreductase [Hyphomonas sp.]